MTTTETALLADTPQHWPKTSETVYRGRYVGVRRDILTHTDGTTFDRFCVLHPGAAAVVALDDQHRVLLLQQYRSTIDHRLIQLPAGLMDVPGEDGLTAAKRELAEEADYHAATWEPLLDVYATVGSSNERWQIFLARDLTPVDETDRHTRDHEESDMTHLWVPLDDALHAIRAGRIRDNMVVTALFAAQDRLRLGASS